MEKSDLFEPLTDPRDLDEMYALVSGERLDAQGAPARTAWMMESTAAALGWRAGEVIGSEAELCRRYGVGRETLREAIRIVESRGAMTMRRGRGGGLRVATPQRTRAAAALAAYLRATGITPSQLRRSARGIDLLIARRLARIGAAPAGRWEGQPVREWLAQASGEPLLGLWAIALDHLAPAPLDDAAVPAIVPNLIAAACARGDVDEAAALLGRVPIGRRAGEGDSQRRGIHCADRIALAIARRAGRGELGAIGTETDLCVEFDASRAVMRQSLRVLQDLDMLEVRRGRTGGYLSKRPSPIAIIRQFFPLLAGERRDVIELTRLMWDLNCVNLRQAGERLAGLPAAVRARCCDRIDHVLETHHEPERFILLQQQFSLIAASPMIDTLARCIVSYQFREGPPPEVIPTDAHALARERAVVAALRAGDLDAAELAQTTIQDEMLSAHLAAVADRSQPVRRLSAA